jgi:hypothetical protein
MSVKHSLAKLFMFAFLQLAVLGGAKITPEEVEKLLNLFHRTKVVHVMKKEEP